MPALGPGALEHPLGALWPLDGGEGLWGKCFKGAASRDLLQPRRLQQVDPQRGSAAALSQGHHEAPSTRHQSWALRWPRCRGSWAGWLMAGLHNDTAVHVTRSQMGPCSLLRAKPLMAHSLQR